MVKILSEEDMKNAQEIRKILPLIRGAFVAPQIITVPEDKKPAVTLLLLNYLEAAVQDGALRKEIVDLIEFVKERTAAAQVQR